MYLSHVKNVPLMVEMPRAVTSPACRFDALMWKCKQYRMLIETYMQKDMYIGLQIKSTQIVDLIYRAQLLRN